MKANYLPKSRLKHPYLKRVLLLVVIFVFGAITFSFFDTIIISAVSPVWKAENVIMQSLRNGVAFFSSQKALTRENTVLKMKLSSLETEILSLSNEREQKNRLLELMGRKLGPNMIAAAVLTHPPQTPYDTIIIDAGSDESITLGSEVFLPEGPILGTVSEVFSRKARVKLFSTNKEETSAVLEGGDVPVILIGIGGGNFKLTVPRDIKVEKGEKILSNSITPQLLAVVEEISSRSTDSFREVLARGPANIFVIRYVFVRP